MSQATLLGVGEALVDLCKQGKNLEAVDTLYGENVVSIEPCDMGEMPARQEGLAAVRGKNQWWLENHEVHSGEVKGPFPHGEDRFACWFGFDVTNKPSGQRIQMEEVAVFTVQDGKIVQEEFFYQMSG